MLKVRPARFAAYLLCGALVYGMAGCGSKQDLASLRTGQMERLLIPGEATPAIVLKEVTDAPEVTPAAAPQPDIAFKDAAGKDVKLSDFKGEILVVNFWATWCAPCKIELPTLGRLQTAYEGKGVKVIAITTDKPDKFEQAKLDLAKAPPLALYSDSDLKLPFAFAPQVSFFPTTIIYDKNGVERARLAAPAEWDSPEAKAVIDALLAS